MERKNIKALCCAGQEDGLGHFGGKLGENHTSVAVSHMLPKLDSWDYIFVTDSNAWV